LIEVVNISPFANNWMEITQWEG